MNTAINTINRDSAFTIQCRVVYALMLRDVKSRYGRRQLGFLWALLEPLLFISLFVGIFHLMGRNSQAGIAAPLFFVCGFSPFFLFRDLYPQVVGCAVGKIPLLMFPQVSRTDVLLSTVILTSLVSLAVFGLLLVVCYMSGFDFHIERPLEVLTTLALLIFLGTGLGLVIGALTIRYEFVASIANAFLGRPLFLASGLFFTADVIPAKAREYLLYNPILHCIESIRSAMFVSFESRYVDLPYVFFFALVLNAFGLMLLNVFDRQRS